ncbi:hypothetical protein V8G54_032767 [Vigna mungo]|uniref:Uncharacterized protein n=1 Tax=Vigna mungo TaxID=3915 RepID=A0AAQ3MN25_VIGMU
MTEDNMNEERTGKGRHPPTNEPPLASTPPCSSNRIGKTTLAPTQHKGYLERTGKGGEEVLKLIFGDLKKEHPNFEPNVSRILPTAKFRRYFMSLHIAIGVREGSNPVRG